MRAKISILSFSWLLIIVFLIINCISCGTDTEVEPNPLLGAHDRVQENHRIFMEESNKLIELIDTHLSDDTSGPKHDVVAQGDVTVQSLETFSEHVQAYFELYHQLWIKPLSQTASIDTDCTGLTHAECYDKLSKIHDQLTAEVQVYLIDLQATNANMQNLNSVIQKINSLESGEALVLTNDEIQTLKNVNLWNDTGLQSLIAGNLSGNDFTNTKSSVITDIKSKTASLQNTQQMYMIDYQQLMSEIQVISQLEASLVSDATDDSVARNMG